MEKLIKKLLLIENNGKKMNKKGVIWLTLWLIPAIAASLGYLINATKPAPATGSVESIISSFPIWGWIVIGLVLLVLIMRR